MSWERLTQQKSHFPLTRRIDFPVHPHPAVSEVQVPRNFLFVENLKTKKATNKLERSEKIDF